MNTKGKSAIKESKMRISTAALMRLAGFFAILGGLGFIVTGMFHPPNEPAYVTTSTWIIVHIFATSMGYFGVLGLAGLYARQVEKAGWLGLIGFLLFSGWMALQMPFYAFEAVILPNLASELPPYVVGWLGMFRGIPSPVDLGALPTIWNISTPMLILGALLFAIATFRAGILPRWAAGLLALGCLMIPVAAVLPTQLQAKIIMIPMGLGMAGMGYALLTERRAPATEPSPCPEPTPCPESSQLSPVGAD